MDRARIAHKLSKIEESHDRDTLVVIEDVRVKEVWSFSGCWAILSKNILLYLDDRFVIGPDQLYRTNFWIFLHFIECIVSLAQVSFSHHACFSKSEGFVYKNREVKTFYRSAWWSSWLFHFCFRLFALPTFMLKFRVDLFSSKLAVCNFMNASINNCNTIRKIYLNWRFFWNQKQRWSFLGVWPSVFSWVAYEKWKDGILDMREHTFLQKQLRLVRDLIKKLQSNAPLNIVFVSSSLKR